MRFECTQCGECCRFEHPDSVVWVTRDEVEEIAALLGVPLAEVERQTFRTEGRRSIRGDADGWCPFLDRATKRCKVYAARPAQCRSFPFWPSIVGRPGGMEAAAKRCEGIGCGEVIPESEIRLRMQEAPPGL